MSLVDLGPKNVNFSAYRRRFRAFEKEFVYLRLGIHLLTYEFRHIAFYARLHSRNLVNFKSKHKQPSRQAPASSGCR